MAAVDDFVYTANMCSELLISDPTTTTIIPYEGAPIGQIASNEDLACTVDTPTACQWGDPDPNHQWWWVENPDPAKVQALTGTSTMPQGGAAYYEFTQQDVTFFGSDEMFCIQTDGDLQFNVWSTDNIQLEVCAVLYQEQREVCRAPTQVTAQPGPARFAFTKAELGSTPVVFIITAYSNGAGFLMIDDIAYTGAVCTDPNLLTPDEQQCERLSSGFSGVGGSTSSFGSAWQNAYSNIPTNAQLEPFTLRTEVFGEKNTRINGIVDAAPPMPGVTLPVNFDGKTDIGNGIAILQSEDLHFDESRYMSVSYQYGTWGSQIYLCKDRVPDLKRRDIPFGDQKCTRVSGPQLRVDTWLYGETGGIVIEPEVQRVFIVAIAPWKYYYGTSHFIVDNVQFHQGTTPDSPPLCVPLD
jgi:hypothetical protein